MTYGINNIFSPFYYKKQVQEHYHIRSKLLKHIEKEYENCPNNQPSNWSCRVHTTQGRRNPILNTVKGYYRDYVNQFLIDINFPECHVDISDSWYNAYRKGQWQESHTHHGNENVYFSAVHFLKYNKEVHPPLTFNNINRILMEPRVSGRKSSIDYWNMSTDVEVNEGDIIFFPSLLEHQVNVQETDDLRVTVSFNIRLEEIKKDRFLSGQVDMGDGDHMDFHMDQLNSFLNDIPNIL